MNLNELNESMGYILTMALNRYKIIHYAALHWNRECKVDNYQYFESKGIEIYEEFKVRKYFK